MLLVGLWTFNLNAQTFTTSGTWTVPPGVTSVLVNVWGAGGGGGGGFNGCSAQGLGSGGGGGGFAQSTLSVTPGDVYTITVGAGGAAGAYNANGGAGGSSSLSGPGGTVAASGGGLGLGGGACGTVAGGAGGAGTTGTILFSGGSGSSGIHTGSSATGVSGKGGGGAGSGSNGTTPPNTCAGAGTGGTGTYPGGNGGSTASCGVGTDAIGQPGLLPGGGGSGGQGWTATTSTGGAGASGMIQILAPCATPTLQPTSLVLTPVSPSIINGSFTAAAGADSYLIVRYPNGATPSAPPVDGVTYTAGSALGNGTIVASTSGTTFSATGLTLSTTYDFYVFSKNATCTPGTPPLYLTASPLTGSATTAAAVTASLGGLWSNAATWGGAVPASTDPVVIPVGITVTIDQLVTVGTLTVNGTLQWNGTSNALTVNGNLTIGAAGRFLPYTTAGTGQALNIAGNFTNNGYANLALVSTILNLNGSQVAGGNANPTLGGTGTFEGDGTRGIIRNLFFQTNGTSTISTTQNLTTSGLAHTAGTLVTNGKLLIDNTAQVYGQALNTQVASVAVTNMGTAITAAPVAFGGAVTQYANGLAATANTRYVSGSNVYLCTTAGTFNATPPTSTGATTFTTSGPTLLYIGNVGTLGVAYIQTALTVGTQYFYNGNLYTAVATTASGTTPPTHLSGTVGSYRYVGTAATVSVNYDATTQTVRSVTVTNPGSGYNTVAPALTWSIGAVGATGTLPTSSVVFFQGIVGPATSSTQKSGVATFSGALTINSDQGASVASVDPQASSGVGAISCTNGGVNYTVAPTVGIAGPSALNLVTNPGSGYAANPTIIVSGGNLVSGTALTTSNFTITCNQGKVVSVYLNTGTTATYSTPPTLAFSAGTATLAFPAGCWATATATIGANGALGNFTITNAGFGYQAAPTVGVGTTSGTANGGTFTTVAATFSSRIAAYNVTYNFFTPAPVNMVNTEGAEIPSNRKLNLITLAGAGAFGANFTSNLILWGTSPFSFTSSTNNNRIDMGGNNILCTWNGFAGTTGSTTTGVTNGSITLTTRGGGNTGSTLNFPFDATFTCFTGTGTNAANGASVERVTVSRTAAPTGTGATMIGTRGYRIQSNAGSAYGTNPTVTLNFNSNDNLISDNPSLLIAQSTAATGPWTIRSIASGTGALPGTGSRTTATTGVGPIVPTGDDYYGWSSSFTPPPALDFVVTRTTGNTYTSIAPIASGGNGTGTLSTAAGDEGTQLVPFTGFTYQGSPVTGFTIHTNGMIILNNGNYTYTTASNWDNTLGAFSAGGTPDINKRNVIAPFYDDLNKATPVIYHKIVGNVATIEWFNTTFFGLSGPQMFYQIVLDGSDNSITFNYGNMQLYNGTQNIRYAYTCGLSGAFIQVPAQAGQIFQQQYENTTFFTHENSTVSNRGANGLAISPEPRSSIKFTPGTYVPVAAPSATAPANDDFASAISRPALTSFPSNIAWDNGTNTTNLYTTRFSTHSTFPDNGCATSATAKDVWFKFNANNTDMTVRIYGSGGYLPRVGVYDQFGAPVGSCTLGTQGLTTNAVLSGLLLGDDYYVRVAHDITGVKATATATVSGGAVTTLSIVDGTNYTVPAQAFGYVPANQGPRITLTGGGGTGAVASLSTPTTPTTVLATMGAANITFNGGAGYSSAPTVDIESPDWGITGEFGIIVFAVAANDTCATAITLTNTSNTSCTLGQNSRETVSTAAAPITSNTSPAATSGTTADDDVWYKFTGVAQNTKITVSGASGFDAVVQVFTGACNTVALPSNMTLVAETNLTGDDGVETINLTTTVQTYWVRVYHAAVGSGTPGSFFNICVNLADNTPPVIANIVASPSGLQCTPVAHTITADVTDDFTVASVNLNWTLNGVAQTAIPMTLGTPPSYSAVIPAQSAGAVVAYTIVAQDGAAPTPNSTTSTAGNYTDAQLQGSLALSAGVDKTVNVNTATNLTASYNHPSGCLKITEITLFKTGTGSTPSYPSYAVGDDLVEITNTGTSPIALGGVHLKTEGARTSDYTFPAATVPAGGVVVVNFGIGTDDIPNLAFFENGSADLFSSGTNNGIWLTTSAGAVIDAVATNGHTFSGGSGVTAVDWTGAGATGLSGDAGTRLTGADVNNPTGWLTASSSTQNIGTVNGGVPLSCVSSYTVTWTGGNIVGSMTGDMITTPVFSVTPSVYTFNVAITDGVCTVSDNIDVTTVTPTTPVAAFTVNNTTQTAGGTVSTALFTDLSTNIPDSWSWNITGPGTVTYVNGTSATSQNPQVQFSTGGLFTVALTATNAAGSNTLTQTNYITVNYIDIYPPVIANVAITPGASCTPVAHTVSADITDYNVISSAVIVWTLNNIAQADIPMTLGTPPSYSGVIPAQASGATVSWFVRATDAAAVPNVANGTAQSYTDDYLTGLAALSAGPDVTKNIGGTANLLATYTPPSGATGCLKITEITLFKTGTGSTPSYPSYAVGDDILEITNTGTNPVAIGGLHLKNEGARTMDYIFPAATIPAGGVIIVNFGVGTDDLINNAFFTGTQTGSTSDTWSSGTNNGIWLTQANGTTVIDAVATNGHVFSGGSGVTAADWSGAGAIGTSGHAGTRLTGPDLNDATNWVTAGTSTQNQGTVNAGVPLSCNNSVATYTITWTGGNLVGPSVANPTTTPVFIAPPAVLTYTATLSDGTCSTSDNVVITTQFPVAPVANFSVNSQAHTIGATISTAVFTDLSTNIPDTWSWNITGPGTVTYVNGTTSTSQNPEVQFGAVGQYTVALTVTNGGGTDTKTETNYITVTAVYCLSNATSTSDEEIFEVNFAGISNNTNCGQTGGGASLLNEYSDYTADTPAEVAVGYTFPFSFTAGSCGGVFSAGYSVYIDYNADGDFADIDEKVLGSVATTSIPILGITFTGSITIPMTATPGLTRMRVVLTESNATPPACGTYGFGETEDYTININPAPVAAPSCPNSVVIGGLTCITATTVQWTAATSNFPQGYKVYIGTDGGGVTTPTSLVGGSDVGNTFILNMPTLAPATLYYYQVTAYNGIGESVGCTIGSFTSGAATTQTPTQSPASYTETMDNGVFPPALPCGVTSSDENFPADNTTWYTAAGASEAHAGTRYLRIDKNANNTTAKDDWFYSAPMNLTAGKLYRIYFWHRVGTAGSENFEVFLSNSNDAATMLTTSAVFTGASNLLTYKLDSSADILPAVGGIYYYGFHANGAANGQSLFMDDIQVKQIPVAAMDPASCITIPSLYDQLLVQPVYQAQDYKFKIENLANSFSYEYTRNLPIPDFRLKWAPGVTYDLSYDVSVSYMKNNVWSPYGPSCVVTMGPFPTTQLRGASCGATLTDLYTPLYIDSVGGANDYEYRIVQNTLVYDHTWMRGAPALDYRLYWAYQTSPLLVERVQFGFTYDVQVRALVGRTGPAQGNLPGTLGTFGPVCTVTLSGQPQTQLVAAPGPQQSCGKTLTNITDQIYCIPVVGAGNYRYNAVNAALGYNATADRNSTLNDFRLNWLPTVGGIGLRYATTYDITVQNNVGGVWSTAGTMCQVTTPAQPLTQLQPAYCLYTLPTFSTPIYCNAVPAATNYRYRITDVATSGATYTKIVDRNAPSTDFRFTWTLVCCGGLNVLPNTPYNVEVASYAGGVWSAYGTVCTVTTSATVPRYNPFLAEEGKVETAAADLGLSVYPNPSAVNETYYIELNGIQQANENVAINIYNVLGAKVYSTQVITKEESRVVLQPEQTLAAGVYTVEAQINGTVSRVKFVVK